MFVFLLLYRVDISFYLSFSDDIVLVVSVLHFDERDSQLAPTETGKTDSIDRSAKYSMSVFNNYALVRR